MTTKQKCTPPQLARRWGVTHDTVLFWIHSGELRAIDGSRRKGQRPRFLIDAADIAAFENSRAAIVKRAAEASK